VKRFFSLQKVTIPDLLADARTDPVLAWAVLARAKLARDWGTLTLCLSGQVVRGARVRFCVKHGVAKAVDLMTWFDALACLCFPWGMAVM
jgi:hypothetical protein